MEREKRQLRLWQLLWMTVLLAMVLGVTTLATDVEETKTEHADAETAYSDIGDSEFCRTPETAASVIRSNLEERSSGFNVYYLSETAVTQEDAESWLEDAYSETGSATEGDYLRLSVVGQLIYVTSETTTEGTLYYQVRYIPKYTDTIEQEAELSEKLSKVVADFEFQEDTSDYDKVKAIYDYICKNVKYDYTHLEDGNYLLKHSAYAALVNNSAVCQGYSALLYRMLKTVGIECRCIRGTDSSGGGHDWNIVNLDGYWYNMDATWDATLTQNNQAYQYFLTGGESFLDHVRDSKYQTEEFCNAYPIHQTGYAKYAGTYGDLTWELSVLGVLTIKGKGPMEDGSLTPWKDYKEEITQICIQNGITSIGAQAFGSCSKLGGNIVLPDGLTEIGSSAFYGCASLNSITLPDSLTEIGSSAFRDCDSLNSITLPDGLTEIGPYAFYDCKDLNIASWPNGLAEIGERAFSSCTALTNGALPEGIKFVGDYAFYMTSLRSVSISCGTVVESCAFGYTYDSNTRSMVTVNGFWIEGITGSPAYYYANSNGITFISIGTMPDKYIFASGTCGESLSWEINEQGILHIFGYGAMGSYANENSSYWDAEGKIHYVFAAPWKKWASIIKTIVIDEGATSIGSYAFASCIDADSVSIPRTITIIESSAFSGNGPGTTFAPISNLYITDLAAWCNIKFEDSLSHPFAGVRAARITNVYVDNQKVDILTIPESVTEIAPYAFCHCTGLKEVTIPSNVKEIGKEAFYGCNNLETLRLNEGLKFIREGAFQFKHYNTGIKVDTSGQTPDQTYTIEPIKLLKYTIPDSVSYIGDKAIGYIDGVLYETVDGNTKVSIGPFLLERFFPGETAIRCSGCSVAYFYALNNNIPVELLKGKINSNNHRYDEGKITTEPTCTEEGAKTYTCKVCGDIYTEPVAKAAHQTELVNAKEATCKEAGYTGDEVCKVCGETIKKGQTIAKLAHTYDEGEITTEPTCTEEGVKTYTCKVCGDIYTEPVAKAAHQTELVNAKEATCKEAGYTGDEVCKVCGTTIKKGRTIRKLAHTYDEGKITTAPTCEVKGTKTYTCTACGTTRTEPIPAAGHSWSGWKTVREATDTEDGLQERSCASCGAVQQKKIPSAGHEFAFVETVAPTCTEEGYDIYRCECGEEEYRNETNALGHSYALQNVVEATCTTEGYSGDWICTRCGETAGTGNTVPALGHDWSDWTEETAATYLNAGTEYRTCGICGETETEEIPALGSPFPDVQDPGEYYYTPVLWAAVNNITNGVEGGLFAPGNTCKREQVVTFLWRAMGSPEPTSTDCPFEDVAEGKYYYKAVLWAVENGITTGKSATRFAPKDTITRAEFVTFLWRTEGKPGCSTSNPFYDVSSGSYYYDAVLWAVENGITTGKSAQKFAPKDPCTRGQVVTFLYRDLG